MGLIKRVVQGSLIYYATIQGYLIYHLKTSPRILRMDSSPSLTADQVPVSRKELLESVLNLYSMRPVSSEMKDKLFAHNMIFEDPCVCVNSRQGLINAFSVLPYLLKSSETVAVSERHYESVILVEFEQKYTTKVGSPIVMPSVLYLTLEKEGDYEKIVRIEEECFGKPLLTAENTRFMFAGYMASVFRKLLGKLFCSFNLGPQ